MAGGGGDSPEESVKAWRGRGIFAFSRMNERVSWWGNISSRDFDRSARDPQIHWIWSVVCVCTCVSLAPGRILFIIGIQDFIRHRSVSDKYEHSSSKIRGPKNQNGSFFEITSSDFDCI
jgi:hypothetical protein